MSKEKGNHNIFRFRNPFKKTKCDVCGAIYDITKKECPNCHAPSAESSFQRSFQEIPNVSPWRELILALVGWLGFQLLGLIVQIVVLSIKSAELIQNGFTGLDLQNELLAFTETGSFYAMVNYPAYILLFACLLLILWKETAKLLPCFKKPKTYLGFAYGALLMVFSIVWGLISTTLGASTNENQSTIISMVRETPFLAILVTGIIGPLCEEITYRVGLFGFAKRINRIFAYFVASVLFGLIHIHDFTSPNEWLSFPDYLVSGLLLAFVYERYGFGASSLAHIMNNTIAVLQILLLEGTK